MGKMLKGDMKLSPINCPECGKRARGLVEHVGCCANIEDTDQDDGSVLYDSNLGSDMWWDEQRPDFDAAGRVTLICDDAHEWQADYEGPEQPGYCTLLTAPINELFRIFDGGASVLEDIAPAIEELRRAVYGEAEKGGE